LQTGFLGIWLAPVGRLLHGIPGCVFHCYSCPLSAFACPVGVAANYAALLPVVGEVPYLLIGLLLLVGAVSGSLVCGWACPFGFLQDLLGKIVPRKFSLPGWVGHLRYVVLVGLVLLLPMVLGFRGIPFERQAVSICRLCPAGALEAGVPYSVQSLFAGNGWMMSGLKTGILLSFLAAALFIHRPWCRIFCPLGGFLSLFNRFSLFHLRFNPRECVECNLCRSRCSMGDAGNHFVANPLNRYSVSDRSGFVQNPDGSVDIFIQKATPAGHESNWLPAPSGKFILWLRAYIPGEAILHGEYTVPPVVEV
jgi:ferredoxin